MALRLMATGLHGRGQVKRNLSKSILTLARIYLALDIV
jgi:hypothetical protein